MANKINKQKFIIPAAVLLLITAAMVYIYFTQETTSKPDPASEKIIREAAADRLVYRHIIKDPNSFTDEYFAYITMIIIEYKDLSDIKLLEKFTNLQHLEFIDIHYPSNKIPKWMSLLAKLGLFNIEERFPIDLSPLANLSNLTGINLSGTNVNDIKPLANLTNLQILYLSDTEVSDIKPLANLKNLRAIALSGTNVSDEQVAELKKALPNTTFE